MKQEKSYAQLKSRPWNSQPAPLAVRTAAGMTSAAEKNMLHWLCSRYVDGRGHVVDAGCFLGASTLAMAAGLDENPKWPSDRKVLALDNFVVTEGMSRLHPQHLGHKKFGESFHDVFEKQVGKYGRMINSTPVDLMTVKNLPSPIELLFIDIAKSKELNNHIVELGFRNLVPMHSLVIQQDYIYELCPWIISTMEYFSERFEFLDFAFGASFLYLFIGPEIKQEEIEIFTQLSLGDMKLLHVAAQKNVSKQLDKIAGGSIQELPKEVIRQVMKLSYVELVLLSDGDESAREAFQQLGPLNLEQDHLKSRINRIAERIGLSQVTIF